MNDYLFLFKGRIYPKYLENGNRTKYIEPTALEYCKGDGIDVGSGANPLKGAMPFDLKKGDDAYNLPDRLFDYIYSSHCLEHLPEPIRALRHWKSRLKEGGTLFLYLPHKDMLRWSKENNRSHLYMWNPSEMAGIIKDIGFKDVLYSERDMNWSFSVYARN